MTINVNDFASIIAQNNSGEQMAIEGYFRMLALPNLPEAFVRDIQEIISDEMNHSEKLSKWVTHFTGVKLATT